MAFFPMQVRSESIATYAICGFSGIPTVCIFLGVWNAVCPSRIAHMSRQMTRAIINANVCCFLTASIVGAWLRIGFFVAFIISAFG